MHYLGEYDVSYKDGLCKWNINLFSDCLELRWILPGNCIHQLIMPIQRKGTRVPVPTPFVETYGNNGILKIVGVGEFFEVWQQDEWLKRVGDMSYDESFHS